MIKPKIEDSSNSIKVKVKSRVWHWRPRLVRHLLSTLQRIHFRSIINRNLSTRFRSGFYFAIFINSISNLNKILVISQLLTLFPTWVGGGGNSTTSFFYTSIYPKLLNKNETNPTKTNPNTAVPTSPRPNSGPPLSLSPRQTPNCPQTW